MGVCDQVGSKRRGIDFKEYLEGFKRTDEIILLEDFHDEVGNLSVERVVGVAAV